MNAAANIVRDSLQLAYREYGSGPSTLLLIHGWSCSGRYWDSLVEYLRPYHRIVTVDLRGFGESPKPPSGYDYADHVADLAALITKLSLRRCVLVGHSMGGAIAMQFALTYPERLAALVIVDSGAHVARGAEIYAALSRGPSAAGFDDPTLRDMVASWFHAPNAGLVADCVDIARTSPASVRMEALGRHIAHDLRTVVCRIALPTLILHGVHDRTRSLGEAQALQRSIPEAELHLIAAAAHTPQIENPVDTSAVLLDFLDRKGFCRNEPVADEPATGADTPHDRTIPSI